MTTEQRLVPLNTAVAVEVTGDHPRSAMDVLADPPRLLKRPADGGFVTVFTENGASCVPAEVQHRRANGENVDVDGWTRKVDLRDEHIESLRSELAETRVERDRYMARVLVLEARLEAVRTAAKS